MIVRSKSDMIEYMFRRRYSINAICERTGLRRTNVYEYLERLGLRARKRLKSPAQREALKALRVAAGYRIGTLFLPAIPKSPKRKTRHQAVVAMIVWRGFKRETEVKVRVRDCGAGAGQITCIECGGTRVGGYGQDEPCVECKGTGRVFVSV